MNAMKITKLTKEQEDYLPAFREEWRKIGLCTDPIDKDLARVSVINLYESAGFKAPKVYFFSSPLMCQLVINLLMKYGDKSQNWAQLGGQLRNQLWGQLGDQLRGQLGDQLVGQLRGQLWDQLRGQLVGQLGGQLGDQLRNQLEGQLCGQLGDQLRGQLGDQLVGQLRGQLWDQLGDQLWDAKLSNIDYLPSWFIGGLDSYWLAFYEFGRHIGVKYKNEKHFNAYINYAKYCGWAYLYDGIAFVSDRPKTLCFDENRLLHSEIGPAISYGENDLEVYSWKGTRIPKEWITQKDKLTPQIALTWENAEQRRCACEIIGWANVLDHESLNPVIIDKDSPEVGTLIKVDLPDAKDQWFLKYQCGTGRWFAEPVTNKDYNTALKANAGGNGWRGVGDPNNYIPTMRS
jgi:hypothetical protein